MRKSFKNIELIKAFFLMCLFYIALGFVFLITKEKIAIHIFINSHHNAFLDVLFKYGTDLGDGFVTAVLVLPIGILLFKKYGYSTFVLGWSSLIFTGFIAQFLKRVVYPNAERPIKFIGETLLYIVPDVEMHEMNSFPSGHTATAFAFFAFVTMAYFRKNKTMQLIMALLAVFVGYSRMYLSLHFLEDVVTGACVGLFAYLLAHILVSILPFKKSIV